MRLFMFQNEQGTWFTIAHSSIYAFADFQRNGALINSVDQVQDMGTNPVYLPYVGSHK